MKSSALQNEKFMVVAFTDKKIMPQSVEARFLSWPSHVPIVPPLQGYRAQASQRMKDFLEAGTIGPITVEVISRTAFGEENVLPVCLLEAKGRLNYLRYRLADAALRNGTVSAHDTSRDHIPHIVESSGMASYEMGQQITLSELCIVSLDTQHGWKQVTKTIVL